LRNCHEPSKEHMRLTSQKPDGNASTQPSILTLDKSEEPFQTQVDLACTILNIDLELQWKSYISSGNYGEEQRIHTSDPRPAHTLRWLLKKLQPGEDEQCSPRLRFKAWLLLRVLLVQTPLAKVARLIKEHKFTSSLRKTLEWLYEHSDARSRPLDLENETNGGRSEASFNSAGSSSNESKSSKKRKRGDAERVDTPSQASWFRNAEAAITDIQGVRTLYLAVCNVIVQLEELSSDPEYSRGIAVEHLKFALRSSSEEAATMLGNSLYIVTQLIRKSCKRLPPEQAFLIHLTDSTYSTCAISLVNSWENRSRGRQDSSDETSNVCIRGRYRMYQADHTASACFQATLHVTMSSPLGL